MLTTGCGPFRKFGVRQLMGVLRTVSSGVRRRLMTQSERLAPANFQRDGSTQLYRSGLFNSLSGVAEDKLDAYLDRAAKKIPETVPQIFSSWEALRAKQVRH